MTLRIYFPHSLILLFIIDIKHDSLFPNKNYTFISLAIKIWRDKAHIQKNRISILKNSFVTMATDKITAMKRNENHNVLA